jgi:NAD(P)-dependent dehydrogenase (short-subunit alcohol dehydrogenase family)
MNIIINGGTKGIGREVAHSLAGDASNRVLVTGRSQNELTYLSEKYENIITIMMDISSFDSYSGVFAETVKRDLKKVDILINMAGMVLVKDFLDISTDEARLVMETNFLGPAEVIRIVSPHMPAGSHIINISSMGGFQGSRKYRGLSYYSASKAALACLSEALAGEFSDSGISVNCLALGAVQTEMFEAAFPGMKAPVDPGKMAAFISYFALNGHKFMNGKIIPVSINNP